MPQIKYKVGKTFGCHTHELLTSAEPEVASSGQLVLSSIEPDRSSKSGKESFTQPIYHGRSRSWGDYKYVPEMVPGYTGSCVISIIILASKKLGKHATVLVLNKGLL